MIRAGTFHPFCQVLALAMAAQTLFAQSPLPPVARASGTGVLPLKISVLEGANGINSIPLLRSVAPVVEVVDTSDFPVEGAVVVFTLPEEGPGGIFLNGLRSFTTKSDARGQAAAPFTINSAPGKFQIRISATLGYRRGEVLVSQTNASGGYAGPALPQRAWYKKWPVWVIAGGVVAGAVVLAATRSSGPSNSTVTVTAGTPIFH